MCRLLHLGRSLSYFRDLRGLTCTYMYMYIHVYVSPMVQHLALGHCTCRCIPEVSKQLLCTMYVFFFTCLQVRDQINSEHRMKELVERSLTCADRLVSLYDDRDG